MNPSLQERLLSLLSRKFITAMTGMLVVAFALNIPDTDKVQFITWIIGIFSAANVVQRVAIPNKTTITETTTTENLVTEKKLEKPTPQPIPSG